VLVQLLIPLVVIARSEANSRDFSWDMFSYQLSCEQLSVVMRVRGGEWENVRLDRDFSSWAQLRRLLSEDRFAAYAQGLCEALQEQRGAPVELHVWSRCSGDRAGEPFAVLNADRDFCSPR
jgi:hypothetical protein